MWLGQCGAGNKHNKNGFFENRRIKAEVTRTYGIKRDMKIEAPHPKWRSFIMETILTEGYKDGPWGVKNFVHYRHIWDDFNPVFILPRRDSDSIFASTRRAGFFRWFDDPSLREYIDIGQRELDLLVTKKGALEVRVDDILAGDTSGLEEAMAAAGMTLNPDIVDKILDPTHFHASPVSVGST